MNLKTAITACVFIPALLFSFYPENCPGEEKTEKRILVLGLQSQVMDEVQERYLRECLLRRLIEMGYPVVTIMEMEEMRGEELSVRLTSLSPEEIRNKALRYRASAAVYGSIKRADGRKTGDMSVKDKYLCDLYVMECPSGDVKKYRHTVDGSKDWELFSQALARLLADDIAGTGLEQPIPPR